MMSEHTLMEVSKLAPGMALPELKKRITQEDINRYAEVSRDFNPIHIDEDFARKTPLGGTIAHGMLVLAYVSQMMTMAFGKDWLTGGKLSVRFKAPARPGDIVNINGKVVKVEKSGEQSIVGCELLCSNQNGDAIIIGETEVRVKQ